MQVFFHAENMRLCEVLNRIAGVDSYVSFKLKLGTKKRNFSVSVFCVFSWQT